MKKLSPLLFLLIFLNLSIASAQVKVGNLLTENLVNPLGIDVLQPNFSWQLFSGERNVMQSAYELRIALEETSLSSRPFWFSGKIKSDQSVHVPYKGAPLASGRRYYWQVRIWCAAGDRYEDRNGEDEDAEVTSLCLLQPSAALGSVVERRMSENNVGLEKMRDMLTRLNVIKLGKAWKALMWIAGGATTEFK